MNERNQTFALVLVAVIAALAIVAGAVFANVDTTAVLAVVTLAVVPTVSSILKQTDDEDEDEDS